MNLINVEIGFSNQNSFIEKKNLNIPEPKFMRTYDNITLKLNNVGLGQ